MIPNDKAKNNVTFVCKKFYCSLLKKEIRPGTFQRQSKSENEIVKDHKKFIFRLCNIKQSTADRKSLSTFNFSTFYTSILHQQLKDNLHTLILLKFVISDYLLISDFSS